jgi:HEAT repeat protein
VSAGLARTIELLTSTGNEAAVEVLLPALDSPHLTVVEATLKAILDRRSEAGQREIVRRWDTLDERLKAIVADRPSRIQDALRAAVLGTDPLLFRNACQALLWVKEYDLLPALLTATENKANPLADEAGHTLLALADLLYDELASPRDYSVRRDPQLTRQHVLTSLENSATRFEQHHRVAALDAFLMLASRENATLKRILLNPHDRSYLPVIDVLTTSARPGVMRLLLAYLEDPHAPHPALNAIAHRTDETFLRHLLKKVGPDPTPVVQANLRRIETFPWLAKDLERLLTLSELEQPAAMQMAACSAMKRLQVFEIVQFLLRNGNVGGRRAAAQRLAEFKGNEANLVAMQSLEDPDPQVQVHILVQLRERGIPSALTRLLELMGSPHAIVRQAAQQCLAEFNFKRLVAAYDMLSPEVRKSTGALVRKVDSDALPQLKEELFASARTRRFRALKIIADMEVATDLENELIALLSDDDHFVRLEAAELLAHCDSHPTRLALRRAMLDRNASVQEAAERSLRKLLHRVPETPLPVPDRRAGGVR